MKPFYCISVLLCLVCSGNQFASAYNLFNAPFRNIKLNEKTIAKAVGAIIAGSNIIGYSLPVIADSRLNAASAAGTRVNSDADSLLRNGLPINSNEAREIQKNVENIKSNLRIRRIPFAKSDLSNVEKLLTQYEPKLLKQMPSNHVADAQASIAKMKLMLAPLEATMNEGLAAGAGSVQERRALDESFDRQIDLAFELTNLQELLVPDEYKREIPKEYADLPVLQRRATVEMVLKKPDNSQFDVEGKLYDSLKLTMVVDGFNAPLTAGNFVDLVNQGFYTNMKIQRSDGFVVQTGDADPEGTVHGYVPKGSTNERKIPLELSLKNDDDILYGATTEEDGRGYQATVLPFQSTGAMGMARAEFESNSASSQFFWLLFESDLTPAGKNMLDGRYTCFGYVVTGGDFLKAVREGDVIQSAKVVKGLEYLKKP